MTVAARVKACSPVPVFPKARKRETAMRAAASVLRAIIMGAIFQGLLPDDQLNLASESSTILSNWISSPSRFVLDKLAVSLLPGHALGSTGFHCPGIGQTSFGQSRLK